MSARGRWAWGRAGVYVGAFAALGGCQVLFGVDLPPETSAGASGAGGSEAGESSGGAGGSAGTGGGSPSGGMAGEAGAAGVGGRGGGATGASGAAGSGGSPNGGLQACGPQDRIESAYYDATTTAWYVSCQGGNAAGDGYIAKLSDDAKSVATAKFITGLDDPKGIRVAGGKLYVADVKALATIDLASPGTVVKTEVTGVGGGDAIANPFLNDVAVDGEGKVYVSDTLNNAIFRFDADGRNPNLVVKDEKLESPNGLLVVGTDLLVASFGPNINPNTFETERLGAVYRIALNNVNNGPITLTDIEIGPLTQRIGNLDGIELDNGNLLLTDFSAGRLFTVVPVADPDFGEGEGILLRGGFTRSAADIGFDPARRMIVVPEMASGKVHIVQLADDI